MKDLNLNYSKLLPITFLLLLLLSGFQENKWIVPEVAQKKTNPVKYAGENKIIARNLYTKHCKSCHGKEGLGDGSKAAELETSTGDFTLPEFLEQSDGTMFYKIREGRDEMPAFDKKMTEEDTWLVVHYIRELGN